MLILSRRPGEELVIRTPEGREIIVRLMSIDEFHLYQNVYRKARIGIQADDDITIHRREILEGNK